MTVTTKDGTSFTVKQGTKIKFLHNQIAFLTESNDIVFLTYAGVEEIQR